jgi:N-acetyltransferase
MDSLAIPTLTGTLEPLAPEHAGELAEAVAEDDLYKVWFTRLPSPDRMSAEIEKRLTGHAAGQIVPWTIRDAHGRAVGMTTFLNIRPDHRRLEIGSTWIAPSVQGTGVNPQVKLLQLTYAFEALECIAVEFRTHWHTTVPGPPWPHWELSRTGCCAITTCGATGPCATWWCSPSSSPSGPPCGCH